MRAVAGRAALGRNEKCRRAATMDAAGLGFASCTAHARRARCVRDSSCVSFQGMGRRSRWSTSRSPRKADGRNAALRMTAGESVRSKLMVRDLDAVLLDQDGVLWHGDEPIAGSMDTVRMLQDRQIMTLFITNNAKLSRAQYARKLQRFGIDATAEHVITSGSVLAAHLAHRGVETAYVIGESGLTDELELLGIKCITHSREERMDDVLFASIELPVVDAVAVGWDMSFSFAKLCHASAHVQRGAYFAATNRDVADVSPNGLLLPGTGPMLSAIEQACKRQSVVVGKPNTELAQHVLRHYELSADRTVMVGDRLDTDILFARRAGIPSALVMSGCTTPLELSALEPSDERRPDVVADSLAHLFQ
mmetsp:Transcript_7170/g.19207  ORF Transcript_7170/g.19207 Transcript_7170/m.19207 type:complete len:364 (-) Transcript_7170:1113-2204(-)